MRAVIPLALLAPAVVLCAPARADTSEGWTGAAGAGPIVFPRYSGGQRLQTWAIPLVSASYGDFLYIEPLRAGLYLWGSADRKMGLGIAAEPRLGFKAGDGSRLAGMAARRDSLEAGPAFDWDLGPVARSISLFHDLTGSSRGSSGRLYLVRDLIGEGNWKLSGFVGAERLGNRVANYFYGVAADEAMPGRSACAARAVNNATTGVGGSYRLGRDYAMIFGMQATRLAGGIAHSPIVETRTAGVAWLGLGFTL